MLGHGAVARAIRRATWSAGAVALTGVVAAQSVLEQAIEDLKVPGRQHGACATLIQARERGAEALRPLLQRVEDADPQQACMALYVLGRLGGAAAAALPEVLHAFARGMQPEVRRQALWAIGQIAPAASQRGAGVCGSCLEAIGRDAASDIDTGLANCVMYRLQLGAAPADEALVRSLRQGSYMAIAAAEAFAARFAAGTGEGARSAAVEEELARLLEWTLGGDYAWDRPPRFQLAAGAMAFASRRAGQRNELVARGLLRHWEPEWRQEGLEALAEATTLATHDGLDVVALLWDSDFAVRDLALGTLAGWGQAAAIALPTLQVAAGEPDRAFAAACRTTAERWIESLQPPAAGLAKGAWGALCGEPVAPFDERQMDAAAESLLAEIAAGCRGTTGGRIGRLAAFVRHNNLVRPSVVDAFVRCLGTDNADAWREALHALAILGPDVAVMHGDIAVLLLRAASMIDVNHVTATAGEAWIRTGSGATADDLRRAIGSDRWHVALRGMLEVVRRGAVAPDVAHAAARALQHPWAQVHVAQGEEWSRARGIGSRKHVTVQPDAEALTAAAGIVLFVAGDPRWRTSSTLQACAALLELPAAEVEQVEARLTELRGAGGLARLCNQIEAAVPALAVGWPPDGVPATTASPR